MDNNRWSGKQMGQGGIAGPARFHHAMSIPAPCYLHVAVDAVAVSGTSGANGRPKGLEGGWTG